MKTIGLLGGMSWESTVGYYRAINEGVKKSLGGLHSAEIILHSVDFDPVEKLLERGEWERIAEILAEAAHGIQEAGADFLLICTNTMHKVAPQIENSISIPLLHIADATAEILTEDNVGKTGLIGTSFTMEHDFYKGRLREKYGLDVLIPGARDRKTVHDVIFRELCMGHMKNSSRTEYIRIINELADMGAEAVILGCTEIGMLINQKDVSVKLYDTTAIHAEKAVEYAL
ncbi:aspartate/glutamate racemase family protein [Desulfobulbus rhabdoformis]|jgi:aspartate racemase|uniref:aspartate/glutamate racemase family protein n=1 Tax=Desulfobulbus rhabdoformis TaxID=34032 RepID=UPI0019664CB4|nr:aspartate/glutamate racemase family protein [Desulfobulbus rhabdoformis]MBM9615079.1 aspartate/glutamate racemase family protein [Desulfobulbus rhabdoformis]